MSIEAVSQQMLIIFMLIFTGALLYRKHLVSDDTSRQISGLVTHLCNPAHLIHSALISQADIPPYQLIAALLLILLAYGILLLCSYLFPKLLGIKREDQSAYRLLTVYGNVGFIGIPLASAVLGSSSLVYVSLNNLVYNILIYTHGIYIINGSVNSTSCHQHTDQPKAQKKSGSPFRLSVYAKKILRFINPGTVSALLTLLLYLIHVEFPVLITETLHYIGRSTTFLSMLVLGVAVGQMSPRHIFSDFRLYPFILVRMVFIPTLCIFFFRFLSQDTLLIHTTALLLAVPAGNLPLILSRQQNAETKTLSQGILLTTLFSLFTIPLVTLLLA
ncbi:MAG: AEC family transporter [Lachnospiraceae bacterium]|nr:AEC family transporter [Lachnospiraceae bacterium]